MSKNGIAWLETKEDRQRAKLEIAQAKRQGYIVADDGTVSGTPDSTKPYYREHNVYDIALLSRRYDGDDLVIENQTVNPLVDSRPWLNLVVGLNVSPASVNEGGAFTITLSAPNEPDGTTRAYTITGVESADINGVSLTGVFILSAGMSSILFNVTADGITEGTQVFRLTLDDSAEDYIEVVINDTSTYGSGLYKRTYSGYFTDSPTWFASATQTGSTADSTLAVATVPTTTSYQWLGYFKPTTTETYTFYTSSDDASYLWIGANAVSGFTTANSLVNNGGEHGTVEQSGSIALTAGVYYPIRIQAGNNGGPGTYLTNYSTPTISKTSTFSSAIFYNTITNGL